MKNKSNLIWYVVIAALVLLGGYKIFRPEKPAANYDTFAKCLNEEGAVMYGAYWCPHCQNEKKAFGGSFQYIKYVECTEEIQKCNNEKITGYPTWIFPDGRKLEGEQGLDNLSRESGCPLPKIKN